MVEQKAAVRQTAARFGVSKSTVHKDITTRLQKLNTELYDRVQTVLQVNKQERHIRGGNATRINTAPKRAKGGSCFACDAKQNRLSRAESSADLKGNSAQRDSVAKQNKYV